MRTVKDLERMLHGEARVRIYSKTGRGNATISAWPSPRVIYMHPDWLDEGRATDAEVMACLMHELGHRKDWVFTAISLLASTGLLLTGLAVLWNLFVVPILNANLGTELPIDKHWIAYGLAMLLAGVLMRWALYGILERRADICGKKDFPEKV